MTEDVHSMSDRRTWADVVAVAVLVASAVVVAWPILAGGYLTYLDNPAHLAEALSLAGEGRSGWSDIAYCGFPVGLLHSPLWYGLLALLVRVGVPAAAAYSFFVFFGFVAPPLALYAVARRHLTVPRAALLSYALLVQRPAIVGMGSALGGMWTFYIAAAALVLLVGRLARPCLRARDAAWIAGLVGVAGLTHLFAFVALVVLAIVDLVVSSVVAGRRRTALRRLAGWSLGVVLATWYWAPMLLSRGNVVASTQNLSPGAALARLLVPTDMLRLLAGRIGPPDALFLAEVVPILALVGLGVAGAFLLRRRRDDVPIYGLALAAAVLVLVAVVAPLSGTALLGHVSWRLLYFVRIGLALVAIRTVASIPAPRALRRPGRANLLRAGAAVLAVVALLGATMWGGRLRRVVPPVDGPEMAEVRSLWSWLESNRGDGWGRVYLQDTFATPPRDAKLARSHVLAMTAHSAGVRQLGAAYVIPYPTAGWTSADLGRIFGLPLDHPDEIKRLLAYARLGNTTHLVTADPQAAAKLSSVDAFEELHRSGRFVVFRIRGTESRWIELLTGGVEVELVEGGPASDDPGYMEFRRRPPSQEDVTVLVKTSYHPFWEAWGETAWVAPHESGLIELHDLSPGLKSAALQYRPPWWPPIVTILAFVSLIAIAIAGSRPHAEPEEAPDAPRDR